MLQEHPGRVGKFVGFYAAQVRSQSFHDVVKVSMCSSAAQQIEKVLAKGFVAFAHWRLQPFKIKLRR